MLHKVGSCDCDMWGGMGWVVATSCGSLQKPGQPLRAGLAEGELVWLGSPKPLQGTWRCLAVVEAQVGATEETKGCKPAWSEKREKAAWECADGEESVWPFSGAPNLQEQKHCLSQVRGNYDECTALKCPTAPQLRWPGAGGFGLGCNPWPKSLREHPGAANHMEK